MARGYYIVDPGLAAQLWPDDDTTTQCLSYLISRIGELAAIPPGVLFELIPVTFMGPSPYPAIGLYSETSVAPAEKLGDLSLEIGDKLEVLIAQIGIESLLALSSKEPVRWGDILRKFGKTPEAKEERSP